MIGWPQNAYVGQKIVCVADGGRWLCPLNNSTIEGPQFGQVYTITAIDLVGGEIFFAVAELSDDDAFRSTGFRPAEDNRRKKSTTAAVEKLKRDVLRPKVGEPVA